MRTCISRYIKGYHNLKLKTLYTIVTHMKTDTVIIHSLKDPLSNELSMIAVEEQNLFCAKRLSEPRTV